MINKLATFRFLPQSIYYDYLYRSERIRIIKSTSKTSELAVVVHLYYTDNWPLFRDALKRLPRDSFDLFITTPASNIDFIESEVKALFPLAQYMVVPNRGRDVLPFVKILKILHYLQYESVLKFHSKKSTHWEGGDAWLRGVMESLIPSDPSVAQDVMRIARDSDTGVVGPKEFYYPLTVNFQANGQHMSRVVTELFGKDAERQYLQIKQGKYGFFAGTMFWARIQSLDPLMRYSSSKNFQAEDGQIDGTFAHGLERLFCIIPEINGKKMYGLLEDDVAEIAYDSGVIPDWSDVKE